MFRIIFLLLCFNSFADTEVKDLGIAEEASEAVTIMCEEEGVSSEPTEISLVTELNPVELEEEVHIK